MANYPARGTLDWDDDLKVYIDDNDGMAVLRQAVNSELANRYTKDASDQRYATAAQGSKADSALQASALTPYSTTTQMNAAILAGDNAVRATGLAVGTDLNTVQTSGNYIAFGGTLALNFPLEGYSGALRVDNFGSGSALQTFIPQSGGAHVLKTIWTRRMISNAWSAWTPNSVSRFIAMTLGAEAYLYDPTAAGGNERQVAVIQTPLGSTNLNDVTGVGSYVQATNTLATLALNYPKASIYGVLDVQRLNSQNVTQTFTTIASSKAVWRRRLSSNVWEPWQQIPLLLVNSPSTQPGVEFYLRDADTALDRQIPIVNMDLGTANLNDVTIVGQYRQASTTNATTANNYPGANAQGILEVSRPGGDASYILQRYSIVGGLSAGPKSVYSRRLLGGTWSAWEFTPTVRWDQSAGRAAYMWDHTQQREQLIYGDTGLRDVTSYLGLTAGQALLRRLTYQVELVLVDAVFGTSAGTVDLPALDAAFRPSTNYNVVQAAGSNFIRTFMGSSGQLRLYNLVSGAGVNGAYTYSTRQPWPTSLSTSASGTASGTIPNF